MYDFRCKLISLDTSSKQTGYSVFLDAVYHKSGIIENNCSLTGNIALEEMTKAIFSFLDSENPDIVVAELPVMERNAKTQRMLSILFGAVYGWCIYNNKFFYHFSPPEWRKLIEVEKPKSKKRESWKTWSLDTVNKLFSIETKFDDQADAMLIGQAYINLFTENKE